MAKRIPATSDSSTAKAARLLEIAEKVRQVPGAFKDGEPNLSLRAQIAFGKLVAEAYEAGAWRWEGSHIGTNLRVALTSADRDRPQELFGEGETVPTWVLNAYYSAVYALTGHLMPPEGEKEEVERDARILADEIEREANRIVEPHDFHVTLQQAAPLVSKHKRTLERWQKEDSKFPLPEVQGQGGTASLWKWSILRLYLQEKTKLTLPEYHPCDPYRPGYGQVDS